MISRLVMHDTMTTRDAQLVTPPALKAWAARGSERIAAALRSGATPAAAREKTLVMQPKVRGDGSLE